MNDLRKTPHGAKTKCKVTLGFSQLREQIVFEVSYSVRLVYITEVQKRRGKIGF